MTNGWKRSRAERKLFDDFDKNEDAVVAEAAKEGVSVQHARKYILGALLEQYNQWSAVGDSLPTLVKLGAYGNKWLKLEVYEG